MAAIADWLNWGISHGYYANYVPGVGDTPHYAVDIATPYHTPITALWSGTVVEQKTGLPYGTEIFIQPDNGGPEYYYYHLDQLYTQPNQHINAGDVIGLSGGQNYGGSNPSTPDESTGAHTHVGFFTGWKQTILGNRPFGPDITSYLKAFMNGDKPTPPLDSQQATDTSSSNSASGIFSGLQQQLTTFGYVALISIVALVLVGFGFYILVHKNHEFGTPTLHAQAQHARFGKIKTAAKVARVAML